MPEDKTSEIDIDKVVAALEKMAETPNTAAMTYRQQLREPRMLGAIRKCQAAGWKIEDIAKLLNEQGLKIKPSTLTAYLREIDADTKGNGEANGRSKTRAPKSNQPSKAAEAKTETSETGSTNPPEAGSAAKAEDKQPINPARRDRKSL